LDHPLKQETLGTSQKQNKAKQRTK